MNRKLLLKVLPLFFVYCLSNLAVAETQILKASTIITMDEKNPRAEAIAFDTVASRSERINYSRASKAAVPDVVALSFVANT